MNRFSYTVSGEDAGKRLDLFLSEMTDDAALTRSYIQKLIETGNVSINGQNKNKNYKLRDGDVVDAELEKPQPLDAKPQNIPIEVVYEDADIIVVNKPKGMVVHPAAGNPDGTLVNALLYHCKGSLSGINGVIRPGIVHRIDKDTSGLLVAAKNDNAHLSLARQIEEHSVTRKYRAVVYGRFKTQSGTVNEPIGRHRNDRKKYCVTAQNSKSAITHYEVIEEYEQFSYVECRLETGRTHQIRVHMAWLGHPVAGDLVYGSKKHILGLEGQCLHAGLLGFVHPKTGNYIEFSAELPEYFRLTLDSLRG